MKRFKQFFRDEEGATAIEYALIVGVIAIVLVAVLTPIGAQIRVIFNNILTAMGG